jgi:hypothetical protein
MRGEEAHLIVIHSLSSCSGMATATKARIAPPRAQAGGVLGGRDAEAEQPDEEDREEHRLADRERPMTRPGPASKLFRARKKATLARTREDEFSSSFPARLPRRSG